MTYKIALLPGDGIGPEVTDAAVQVIKTVGESFNIRFKFKEELIGGSSYEKYNSPLTNETLQTCYDSDAVFLGAVGGPKWEKLPHHLKPEAALLKLRKELDRKSTRLNSSHLGISYAVFCLKKKTI